MDIFEALENKSWGYRQFSVKDPVGNVLTFSRFLVEIQKRNSQHRAELDWMLLGEACNELGSFDRPKVSDRELHSQPELWEEIWSCDLHRIVHDEFCCKVWPSTLCRPQMNMSNFHGESSCCAARRTENPRTAFDYPAIINN